MLQKTLFQKSLLSDLDWIRRGTLRAEIWEGDERSKSQLSESGDALNDPNLFTELPFKYSLPEPSVTECLHLIQ